MKNQNIKIELQAKDATAMFALLKIIGWRDMNFNDEFSVDHHLSTDEIGHEVALILFECSIKGIEDVARIITGISELGLTKEEK